MKALVYHGPGNKAWEEVPDPVVQQPTDVIVRIDTTTICGTDLHILKGDVPVVTDGRILGHEGVGTVTEVGSAVSTIAVGDRVIISCISACGACSYCHEGLYAHCLAEEGASGIGWIWAPHRRHPGRVRPGPLRRQLPLQAAARGQRRRGRHALRTSCPPASRSGSATATCSPGRRRRGGRGPVGLAAMMTSGLYGAARVIALDLDANRLEQALGFGATDAVNSADPDWREKVLAMTDGFGVDVAIEAVGIRRPSPPAPGSCGPASAVANAGVHGKGVELALQDLWIMDLSITMGLVSTNTTPMLLKLVAQHRLPAEKFATTTSGCTRSWTPTRRSGGPPRPRRSRWS